MFFDFLINDTIIILFSIIKMKVYLGIFIFYSISLAYCRIKTKLLRPNLTKEEQQTIDDFFNNLKQTDSFIIPESKNSLLKSLIIKLMEEFNDNITSYLKKSNVQLPTIKEESKYKIVCDKKSYDHAFSYISQFQSILKTIKDNKKIVLEYDNLILFQKYLETMANTFKFCLCDKSEIEDCESMKKIIFADILKLFNLRQKMINICQKSNEMNKEGKRICTYTYSDIKNILIT